MTREASCALTGALREAREAEAMAEQSRERLRSYVRVRTLALQAEELTTPGASRVSLVAAVSMAGRAFCAAPLGWLRFAACFLPRALILTAVYLCADGDGRMRAIRGMLAAASFNVPRRLLALQHVTDIAPLLPILSWVQLELFGRGGVSTCPASALIGGGEWLWPTPPHAAAPRRRACSRAPPVAPPVLEPPFAQRRLVLYIHGGAFVLCNPATHRSLTANLARHLGCTVLAATYRRAPRHAYPGALDGLLDLYRTLLGAFPAHGIVLAGESAGANLALALCLRAAQLHLPPPAGLILLSPWADLSDTTSPSWAHAHTTDYLPLDLARLFAAAYAGPLPLADPHISPLHDTASFVGAPRTLVVYGEGECLADQQAALVERLREARVPTSAFACAGAMHGFPLFADAAYWGWNARGARASTLGAARGTREETAALRGAAEVGAGAIASFVAGANIDSHAAPGTPGAVQAFHVMRGFARAAWDASLPADERAGAGPAAAPASAKGRT
ncbi:hypothetical protein KFE25_006061 [Diacronema lutheri]|uniref:Alpha/beta hydrolase fold-3 domain-containing protein n=2 Tax=Diacronema lutheri TaxID=2081491 RepID=A0A8J5XV80_DIALT|nr:hypothetical protein KFE25_006061 [Diacronema lutheri]